jgi:hypothetical protein
MRSGLDGHGGGSSAGPEHQSKDRRDETLWALLPPKDAPYAFRNLSKSETDALVEALSDGFGHVLVKGSDPLPLPEKVKSGLLDHFIYCWEDSEYDHKDFDHFFWNCVDDEGGPSPYEVFPLGFHQRRLRVYFQNQFERFCERLAHEDPEWASFDRLQDRWLFEQQARKRLYEKPWYEFHALQFLDWIELFAKEVSKYGALATVCISDFAGQLGRLIEQYYWRFRFEGAAITGVGARKGASAGGRAKARLHQTERSSWQSAASNIWARRPGLSKVAVAKRVRKELGEVRTAKHIARYIVCP